MSIDYPTLNCKQFNVFAAIFIKSMTRCHLDVFQFFLLKQALFPRNDLITEICTGLNYG